MKVSNCVDLREGKAQPVKKSSVLLGNCRPVPVQIYFDGGVNYDDGDGGEADGIKHGLLTSFQLASCSEGLGTARHLIQKLHLGCYI